MALLSPLDLLTVSTLEQDVIRCLVRRPCLTAVEIAKFTRIPLAELEGLLTTMVQEARLVLDDQNKFQVLLGGKENKQKTDRSGLLDSLFG
ncbi:MAG: hypothetical protein HC804_05075 [Anaerolineae bacterium]|nr:hypothetical protein [Anaerolineae bacterium]